MNKNITLRCGCKLGDVKKSNIIGSIIYCKHHSKSNHPKMTICERCGMPFEWVGSLDSQFPSDTNKRYCDDCIKEIQP